MELNRIKNLLEKYFEGKTSIPEEKQLQQYFSSKNVDPHLIQYVAIFKHFADAKKEQFNEDLSAASVIKVEKMDKKSSFFWLSIAASFIILLGIGTYLFYASETIPNNESLGTYDDPKLAFEATQKALALLSYKVNVGIESVEYVEEYEITKNRIFRNTEN